MWTSISQNFQMTAVVQYICVGPGHATTMGWQVGGTRLVTSKHASPYGIGARGRTTPHPVGALTNTVPSS